MARKKKKLPENFAQLIEAGDLDAVKAVFETHEIDAKGGELKQPAIRLSHLPAELVRWLVANGADLTATDSTLKTVLDEHAHMWGGSHVPLLIELGADPLRIDKYGRDALYYACDRSNVDAVRALLAAGANPNAAYEMGDSPLKIALDGGSISSLAKVAQVAELLLAAGANRTPAMKQSIRHLGKMFQLHGENLPVDRIAGERAGLNRLYEIFEVEPVRPRVMHDGTSPIEVTSTTWRKQHGELWDLLVPTEGPCKTVQGEVIRVSGRVAREILDNGAINWDADWTKMANSLRTYTSMGTPLPPNQKFERDSILIDIIDKSKEQLYRLSELSVAWVLANRQPIALGRVEYRF